jgi:hypothetical protein
MNRSESPHMKLGRADTMKLATLLVSVLYLATGVEAILPGPDPSAMAKCNADCAAAGHCCDGSTGQSSHALLSCNHGCQIAWYAANMAECKAHCQAGNAGGCFYKHAEAGKLAKCGSCQSGCDSSDRDECVTGCDLAFASGLFYRDLHYTPPPPPPPHPHAACNVPTGMTATFLENMATHGYWSASAVFDDEEFAHVQPGRQWLQNPRGMLCVDGETTPRSRIELFDDGLGGDDSAGDSRFTRSCLRLCPGVLASHGVLEECINCGGSGRGLLGILSASLRGQISHRVLPDKSPESHPGCDSVLVSSHGIFAVCPGLMPLFPKLNAWQIQAPNQCVPCRKAMDHFGEAFDFFSFRGRVALDGSGDNYIRVRDTIAGLGFPDAKLNKDRWGFGARACTETTRVQGIAWGQYETGYTHELAHWIGVDFNGNQQLPEYHFSDGAHLNGACARACLDGTPFALIPHLVKPDCADVPKLRPVRRHHPRTAARASVVLGRGLPVRCQVGRRGGPARAKPRRNGRLCWQLPLRKNKKRGGEGQPAPLAARAVCGGPGAGGARERDVLLRRRHRR